MHRRRTVKLDANHVQVCREARKQGVNIIELLNPLDTLCRTPDGYISFIEIKTDDPTWTRDQLKFISSTPFPVAIATTADELVRAMREKRCLSQMQKDQLAGFLEINKGDQWRLTEIARLLNT